MIATKEFIEDKILRSNRKYSTLRVTDGDTVIARFSIEKCIDKERYRRDLDTRISEFIEKYGPFQYRDEYYDKKNMCLVVEGSSDKLAGLHPTPILMCDRVSDGDNCVVLDISQKGRVISTAIPNSFTFAISKKYLKELAKTIIDEEEQDEENNDSNNIKA